jgi:hypothetical protein
MPNWKKVVVSGSAANLSSLHVDTSVTASIFSGSEFIGNLSGTASQAISSSYALTASYVSGSSDSAISASYALSSSYALTASYIAVLPTIVTGSNATFVQPTPANTWTFVHNLNDQYPVFQVFNASNEVIIPTSITANNTTTATITFSVPTAGTAVASIGGFTGSASALSASYAATASFAFTASYALNVPETASYAISASHADDSDNAISSSYALTASYVQNAQTASYVLNAISSSFATSASYSITSSYAVSASYALSSDTSISASYALTASHVNPLQQDVYITGSLNVTGSTLQTGNNTLIGNTVLSGSVNISGSTNIQGTTNFSNSSTTITGSLLVSGSTTQIGNNNLLGNTVLSGSLTVSGSQGTATANINFFGDVDINGNLHFSPINANIDNSISASYIYVSGSTEDLYFTQNGAGYSNTTRLRWIEGNLYTGLLDGGLITSQSSTVYQISSGSGIIVSLNASLNNNPYPTVQYLNWGNLSQSIAPLTSSYQQAFVGIQSNGTIFQQGTPFTPVQNDALISIGNVLFQNQSTINGFKTQPYVAYGLPQRQDIFTSAFGPLKLSGYTLAPSGSSTGSLIVGSGTAYSDGANYPVDPNNPSYVTDSGTNVSKIFRYYQSGSTWVYNTNGGAGYPTIDPTNYSNNGVLTTVQPNDWSIQRVFWYPNSVTKAIVVYYGNASYATEAEAAANIPYEPFVEAPNTAANAIYLGAIVISGNGVFTNANTFKILPGGLFRQVGGSGGGGSVVTQTLAGLSDVQISGQTDGQPLAWSDTAGHWINSPYISASVAGNASSATSASYASTSSWALNAINANTASYVESAQTASYVLNAVSASRATSAANADTASYVTLAQTASYVETAQTASYVLNAISASEATLAQTASYVLQAVSASYATNSTSASRAISAANADTASYVTTAQTASFVLQAVSSSYALTASYAANVPVTASYALTASYVENAQSASYVLNAVSSSYALTASYALNAGEGGATTGSNTFIGDQVISGSLAVTGSVAGNVILTPTTASNVLVTAGFNGMLISPVQLQGSSSVAIGSNLIIL